MFGTEVFERGKRIAAEFDIRLSMPRTTRRQQDRVNVPATYPEFNWQRAIYLPFIDHPINEMSDRLLSLEDHVLVQLPWVREVFHARFAVKLVLIEQREKNLWHPGYSQISSPNKSARIKQRLPS